MEGLPYLFLFLSPGLPIGKLRSLQPPIVGWVQVPELGKTQGSLLTSKPDTSRLSGAGDSQEAQIECRCPCPLGFSAPFLSVRPLWVRLFCWQTSVFTPAYGSITNVRINSTMTTPQVLKLLLNKFKASSFCWLSQTVTCVPQVPQKCRGGSYGECVLPE